MKLNIDYFFAAASPWAYLGHERLRAIASKAGASINVYPIDLNGTVFPVSGGVPLEQRSAQRQAYRLCDLERHSKYHGIPLNKEPRFFPVNGNLASRAIIAVNMYDSSEAAMNFTDLIMKAVWKNEQDISDARLLLDLLTACHIDVDRMEKANDSIVQATYATNSELANQAGIFGAPSYVLNGEIFWGQDRLDLLSWTLSRLS